MKRILVVDDEVPILRMNSIALRAEGYEVDQAAYGDEALTMYNESTIRYDLVITDLQMPGMSGVELAEAIRAIEPTQPIIVCSARLAEELAELGITVPPDIPLVNKPFEIATLIARIQQMLA